MIHNKLKLFSEKGEKQFDLQHDFDDYGSSIKVFNLQNQDNTMVMVNSAGKGERPSPMENVPKLPPISGATPNYQYSENPFEIDLSFRSLDYIAFHDQRRAGMFVDCKNNLCMTNFHRVHSLYFNF